jgi:hypothetical protein
VALGQVFSENSVSPANLHSICFSTIIFIITRGWHNRPGVAAVPIVSQSRIKKKIIGVLVEVKQASSKQWPEQMCSSYQVHKAGIMSDSSFP